jgi:hypothetical protein
MLPLSWRARSAVRGLQPPTWLNRAFLSKTRATERWIDADDTGGYSSFTGRRQYSLLVSAISMVSVAYYRERACIDVTYPYLHRPLVEFLLAIPPEQKIRPGENRSLQRRAMRGILPDQIRVRTTKQGPDEALCRAVIRQWTRLVQLGKKPMVCDRGYVDRDALLHLLTRVKHGVIDQLQPLARVLALELWLRSLQSSSLRYTTDRP